MNFLAWSETREWRILRTLQLACIVVALGAFANRGETAPFSEDKVRRAIEHWVRHVPAERRADAVVEKMEAFVREGSLAGYVVHLAKGGYCLAGADSLVLPVYWYSPAGRYDPSNPELQTITQEIGHRTGHLRREMAKGGASVRSHKKSLDQRAALWQDLVDGGAIAPAAADGSAEALSAGGDAQKLILPLTSQWHQGTPYNDDCPLISGSHALVGCVATASAQVMRYWRWPSTYDWSLLEDTHSSTLDDGGKEVAKLCSDVGIAVNMNYGLTFSSAVTRDAADALHDDFDYDRDAKYDSRDVDAMVEDLQWLRPVLLRGEDSQTNGHCWVVYGYDKGTSPWQFAMNLGWGPGSSGWYSVDDVPSGYIIDQAHVTRIAPKDAVQFAGSGWEFGNGTPGSPYYDINTALSSAADRTTLILKANSTHTLSAVGSGVITKPITLKGFRAIITK